MNDKLLAEEILQDIVKLEANFGNLKGIAERFILDILKAIRNRTDSLPEEQDFLKVIAELIRISPVYKKIPGYIRGIIRIFGLISKALRILDKYILDKFLGVDWYNKLLKLLR